MSLAGKIDRIRADSPFRYRPQARILNVDAPDRREEYRAAF